MYFISFSKQPVVQGTTFVLQKSVDPRQMLLSAISAGTGVKEVLYYSLDCPLWQQLEKVICTIYLFVRQVIDDITSSKNGVEADLNTLVGEWQLLWASQVNLYFC